LGGRQVWFDRDVLRLNYDNRGEYLGEYLSDDLILVISSKGNFYTSNFDLSNHYDKDIIVIEKFDSVKVWTVALWDAEQKFYYLKRFQLEATQKPQNILGENAESRLMLLSDIVYPRFEVVFGGNDAFREALIIDGEEFIGVKSYKAKGKRLTTFEVETINEIEPIKFPAVKEETNLENEAVDKSLEINEEELNNKAESESELKTETEIVTKIEVISDKTIVDKKTEKKQRPSQNTKNDSVLPDDIIEDGISGEENDGQLTLF